MSVVKETWKRKTSKTTISEIVYYNMNTSYKKTCKKAKQARSLREISITQYLSTIGEYLYDKYPTILACSGQLCPAYTHMPLDYLDSSNLTT
jgi:hypothetical protein